MRVVAVAAALVAASSLPDGRLGIAVPLVAALMLTAAGAALRVSVLRLILAVLALALAAQAALLDATWVVVLDLSAAWVLASLAAGGLSLTALAAPVSRLREVPSVTPRPSARHAPALRGAALATLVVLPFLILFLSADAAFAGFAGDLPLPDGASLPARIAVLAVILAAALGLGLVARSPLAKRERLALRQLSMPEWAIPLSLLNLLFAAFVGVQIAVLFGGQDRVLETEGLTYAEYARSGFWQLLTAAALTFAVVAAVFRYAPARNRRETIVQRALLVAFCALTGVVLASAHERLQLYEDAFGLTRLRLLAETVTLWLGVLLVLVAAAACIAAARRRLGTAAVLATSAGLLAFSIADPDRRVAERNVNRWEATGRIDLGYVAGLSADAVPPLLRLPYPERGGAIWLIRGELAEPDPWSSANRSRARARDLLGL